MAGKLVRLCLNAILGCKEIIALPLEVKEELKIKNLFILIVVIIFHYGYKVVGKHMIMLLGFQFDS